MHKRWRMAVILLFLVLCGCSIATVPMENAVKPANIIQPGLNIVPVSEAEEKPIVLGFSQVGAESRWRNANTKSIQDAARQAGIELRFSDAEQQQSKQIEAIRSYIAAGVDIIAFSPVVETGWDTVLKEAKDAGIPVIVTDRSVDVQDHSLYVTLIGSNFVEEGRKAAKYVLDKMRNVSGPIRVVELQGTVNSAPALDRKKGFEEVIKENANMNIIASESGNFTREEGKLVMERFLKQHGRNIQVLFAHNDDMALGAIEAIEAYGLKPGKDIIIVSVDGGKEAFQAMMEGKLNCTVECNPLLGPLLMQAAKELVSGRNLPKRIIVKEGVFTQGVAAREIENRKY